MNRIIRTASISIVLALFLEAPARTEEYSLRSAVLAGDGTRVREWLAKGADPNQRRLPPRPKIDNLLQHLAMTEGAHMLRQQKLRLDQHTEFPLHAAIWSGRIDMVELLLKAGAKIEARLSTNGMTPMHLAVDRRKDKIVRLLIDQDANLEARDQAGRTPLHHVLTGISHPRYLEPVLLVLLDKGANIDAVDRQGHTVLHRMAQRGTQEMVQALLSRKPKLGVQDKEGRTPLHHATLGLHHAIARMLLAAGADIRTADHRGFTSLHYALRRSPFAFRFFQELVDAGAPIDVRDKEKRTLLYWAVQWERPAAVRFFLRNKHDPNARDQAGNVPLHRIVQGQYWQGQREQIVRALLQAGADPALQNQQGKTPFQIAVDRHDDILAHLFASKMNPRPNVDSVKIWAKSDARQLKYRKVQAALAAGGDPNALDERGTPLLVRAVTSENSPMVDLLLANKADLAVRDGEWRTLAQIAVMRGSWLILKKLLEAGMDPDDPDQTYIPLHEACRKGHVEIARLLLEHGANPNSSKVWARWPRGTHNALHLAIDSGDPALVDVLLEFNADPNSLGGHAKEPAFSHAFDKKEYKICRKLLAHPKANVNQEDHHGKTILHHAAGAGDFRLVEQLLKRGASINAIERESYSPLHWAIWGGQLATVKRLLEHGANANVQGTDKMGKITGTTPLHEAARSRHRHSHAMLLVLLTNGARVNARDHRGKTPLHALAEYSGNVQNAHLLLDRGADTKAKDSHGRTPHDYAKLKGYSETAELIRCHEQHKRKP